MRCSVLVRLAATGGLLLVLSSEAYVEHREITVSVPGKWEKAPDDPKKLKSQIGIGFDALPGNEAHTLKVTITPEKSWQIISSEPKDQRGRILWKREDPKVEKPPTHQYKITGVTSNDSHSVRFHGVLSKRGGVGEPPTFDVSVAQVDIDVDTLAANRHLPHWPPTGEEMEDRIEDIVGYFLPSGMLEGDFPEKLEELSPEIQNQTKEIRIDINTGYAKSSTRQPLGKVKIDIPQGIALYRQGHKVSKREFDLDEATFSETWRLVSNQQFTQPGYIQMEFSWKEEYRPKNRPKTGTNFNAKDRIRVFPTKGSIRFIRQNNTPIPHQGEEACLMISKRKTDIDINTPKTANFEGPVPENPDPDTFRLEVLGLPPGLNPTPEVCVAYIGEDSLHSEKYETVERMVNGLPVYRSKLHLRLVSTHVDNQILNFPEQTLLVKLSQWIMAGVSLDGQTPGGTSLGLRIGRPPQEDGPNAIRTADLRFIVFGEQVSENHIQDATEYISAVWSQAAIRFHIVEQLFKEPVRNILTVEGRATQNGVISITVENKQVSLDVQSGERDRTIAPRLATAIAQQAELPASVVGPFEQGGFQGWIVLVNKGRNVKFSNIQCTVPGLRVEVPTLKFDFSGTNNRGIESLELSCLSLNFRDDDPSTIDVFVVGDAKIKGHLGGLAGGDWLKDIIPAWENVIFVQKAAVFGGVPPDAPFILAHELGHVLLNGDDSIHENDPYNLMKMSTEGMDCVDAPRRLTQAQHERARRESGPGSTGPVLLQKK
ncbi:MAG: hypothetical protein NZ602_01000 [Thermoguttaceae bacterium]|nr:hypothetical protein [Thermoguttaceae bacterium]MDW8036782.1 hypothetical protein [Thermoguttaceae bacterium]